jgi:hypothetical protein
MITEESQTVKHTITLVAAGGATLAALSGFSQARDAAYLEQAPDVAYPDETMAYHPLPLPSPMAKPNLVQDGNRWIATIYDDASSSHRQLKAGGIYTSVVYCFSYTGRVGTHDRYTYTSPTFPTLKGRATQEGDHVVMHGDFGITVDPGPVVFENVGHEAASWDVATNNQGNVGTGDYTSWFETSHPTGGSTLAFANVQFKRSGSCGSIREIDAADFRVPRELESLVPMEGPIEAPVSER